MTGERNAAAEFSQRVDAPYWEGLGERELRIQRCDSCRRWAWPPDWRCPACGSYDLGWEAVEPVGTVFSWIRTHYPFVPAYADLVPYENVLVELPQAGGARLIGLLTGGAVRVGDRVRGTFVAASGRTADLPVLTWTKES
ncbi:DNA-binding protein [Amycolatopsis sp. K13G38]|uniref:DNA-binding protein n=1 Tax=Amycolatopsis acididurans TaxID=2724524 RepID=A0ABX1JEQ1_9PSEU|nr:zinc ribbon domain-containing protein [Amycolatopsis acididurans]NKQ56722.1 DNA-binding protein [Amycolatopsis acididurans]